MCLVIHIFISTLFHNLFKRCYVTGQWSQLPGSVAYKPWDKEVDGEVVYDYSSIHTQTNTQQQQNKAKNKNTIGPQGHNRAPEYIFLKWNMLMIMIGPKNINLVEDVNIASCQVSLNSVKQFQRRSRKCLSQSETRTAIVGFRSARKTQTW